MVETLSRCPHRICSDRPCWVEKRLVRYPTGAAMFVTECHACGHAQADPTETSAAATGEKG